MTEAATDISPQPTPAHEQPSFRDNFDLNRKLPWALTALDRLSMNFYWSWQPDGAALFRDIDPGLWDRCEQHPRALLKEVGNLRLWQRANDAAYIERLTAFTARHDAYLSQANDSDSSIAYFCAEFGVHNSLPNYSGGLGILAGDHLKSASDLNTPLTAIGLLYRYGYFRQSLRHDGWQEERYADVFESELALTPVYESAVESLESEAGIASPSGSGSKTSDSRLTVCVHIRGREVWAQAWLASVGRIRLYLLDTNLPQNSEVDRLITGHLYGGDTETRIVQEKVLGIGGVRLLRKLGIDPAVYHLNEGHAAFSTLELASEHLAANADDTFADAVEAVREKCVFTTHTPVAAGNDTFPPDALIECFSEEFLSSLKISKSEFLALGRADLSDDHEYFGMTPLALRMCRSSNGVSEKHGEVSRSLWQKMFPNAEVPITSVTNGVHAPTWIAPLFQDLYLQRFGEHWLDATRDAHVWAEYVNSLGYNEIWSTHQSLKGLLIAYIRHRLRTDDCGDLDTIHEHESTKGLFSPDVLTIGFARRVAAYKRWDLIFSDLERLLRLVDDDGRPVQFVFAGKAHPQDNTAKKILQELMSINHDSNWQRRAVFIEDYDQEIARYLVHGVDVWMNVPRRPMEASGTSGMKAAMNGVLNFSILDGWWIEGYNGENGFAIEGRNAGTSDEEVDAADADSMYAVLENEVIPTYYDRGEKGFSSAWVARMRNAIATLTPKFSSDRMLHEYLTRIYKTQ